MGSASETGHAKNVAAFNSIISFCQGYGSIYNPAPDDLKLINLQTQLAAAQTALEDCKDKQLDFDQAVDKRMAVFAKLKPLSQKLIYALKASGAPQLSIEAAETIYRKIQGRRKEPVAAPVLPVDPSQPPAKTISVSQVSYDNLMANFSALLQVITKVSEYQPNEEEMTTSKLEAYLSQLKTSNQLVVDAYTAWSNNRIARDGLLYNKTTGMVAVAAKVKNYVKSLYGLQSPQYKQLSGLQFNPVKI